jgi:hypothetical protein
MADKVKLTKADVLACVASAVAPYSNYIGDEVHKLHRQRIAAGGKGFPPRAGLVLARLNALASDGLLERSGFTTGYYGYRWTLTPLGLTLIGGGE